MEKQKKKTKAKSKKKYTTGKSKTKTKVEKPKVETNVEKEVIWTEVEKPKTKQRKVKPIVTKDDFIEEVKYLFGDKYDLSLMKFKNVKTKVCIICPEHGKIWVRPKDFIINGCPKCK